MKPGQWLSTPVQFFRSFSLRVQVAVLLALAMLPVGIFAFQQGIKNYSETKRLRQETFILEALQAGRLEQAAINEAFGALGVFKVRVENDAPDRACRTIFKDYAARKPGVAFVGFIDGGGKLLCSVPETESAFDIGGTTELTRFIHAPRRSVTARATGDISGESVLVLSEPVYREGKVHGGLIMSISSQYLAWVARKKEVSTDARYTLVAMDDLNVARSQDPNPDWLPAAEALNTLLVGREQVVQATSREGHQRIFAIEPLFEREVFAVASWPDESGAGSLDIRALLLIALPLLMWALAIAVAYVAVDRLALRHVIYLDRLVGVYGRSGRRLRASGMRDAPAEIAKLGDSFDAMAGEIETRKAVLTDALNEKEILLREINHRVKNNLQMISSLTNLQIRDAVTSHERIALESLQERIHGLAAVYHEIYEAENMNEVRIDQLIAGIARKLTDNSVMDDDDRITLSLDLIPIASSPDVAVPITLFATEAIVNVFKHALGPTAAGALSIVMIRDEDALRLCISNTLSGETATTRSDQRKGIGQKLIDGFAIQLRGTVEREWTYEAFSITLNVPWTDVFKEGAS